MQLEIRILEFFIAQPDACESATGIGETLPGMADPRAISAALQNLTNCGLLHRFGEAESAVYYASDPALMRAVLQMLRDKQHAGDLSLEDEEQAGSQ